MQPPTIAPDMPLLQLPHMGIEHTTHKFKHLQAKSDSTLKQLMPPTIVNPAPVLDPLAAQLGPVTELLPQVDFPIMHEAMNVPSQVIDTAPVHVPHPPQPFLLDLQGYLANAMQGLLPPRG